jgi:CRISPR-associated protein Cmr3
MLINQLLEKKLPSSSGRGVGGEGQIICTSKEFIMSIVTETQTTNNSSDSKKNFTHLITIHPLGFLYGSAGGFLNTNNLVGRSGRHFPPNSATLSGVFAYHYGDKSNELLSLQLAGAFWACNNDIQKLYVPTPMNCLVKDYQIQYLMSYQQDKWKIYQDGKWEIPPSDKFTPDTWINISDWDKLQNAKADITHIPVKTSPWKFNPHLHPELQKEERITQEGRLFLENAVQLNPDVCLVYLSNTELPSGWYRFGGEGHLVEIKCHPLRNPLKDLLNQPLNNAFSLITPALWGSNRFSYRAPNIDENNNLYWGKIKVNTILTQRPQTHRYRLGNRQEGHSDNQPKLLSRGRYAVPSGSIYLLEESLITNWEGLEESLFPSEGHYTMKRWGSALALPLKSAYEL